MTTATDLAEKLVSAFKAGVATATALKVGDEFTGAFGAARTAGFYDNAALLSMFAHGYLGVIDERFPRGVLTDAKTGRILAEG